MTGQCLGSKDHGNGFCSVKAFRVSAQGFRGGGYLKPILINLILCVFRGMVIHMLCIAEATNLSP